MLVAADCEEIAAVVRGFGGRVELTSPDCASGTDRVAEIARKLPDVDIFVNVQGDEPEISARAIDLAVELLESDPAAVMSTLATPIRTREQAARPGLRESDLRPAAAARSTSAGRRFPFARNWDDALLTAEPPHFHQHIGLYAYRREFLLQLAELAARRHRASRESRAAPRPRRRPHDPRRHDRRADDRHRHAGGLSGVCRAMERVAVTTAPAGRLARSAAVASASPRESRFPARESARVRRVGGR